jgi:hypothetical protein
MPAKKQTEPPLEPTEPTAAEAAAAEATPERTAIIVQFRGTDFRIPADILSDARFRMAIASMQDHNIVYEALGQDNVPAFLNLIQRGDQWSDVSVEFLGALSKAAGWGNSQASRRS